MTEEIKTENCDCGCEKDAKCECKCCKCFEKIKEFTFKAGAVFVGTTLAILLCASLLKPQCPPPPMMHHGYGMGMERPIPPAPHMKDMRKHRKHFRDFRPDKIEYNAPEKAVEK